ncbi:hypothetical protein CGRA01v4_01634 [Colletotrichum graminicola]|nr:hypothetical protein CGRA01v4_01634 [Colletotrichum graminicola]
MLMPQSLTSSMSEKYRNICLIPCLDCLPHTLSKRWRHRFLRYIIRGSGNAVYVSYISFTLPLLVLSLRLRIIANVCAIWAVVLSPRYSFSGKHRVSSPSSEIVSFACSGWAYLLRNGSSTSSRYSSTVPTSRWSMNERSCLFLFRKADFSD